MSSDPNHRCPVCNRPLQQEALGGLCPSCMLSAGLAVEPHGPGSDAFREPCKAAPLTLQAGADASPARLRVRCPQCGNLLELETGAELSGIRCDTCGTRFSVVDETVGNPADLDLGQVGQFQIVEKIGVGAFGAVWKARDLNLDRWVALKIPRRGRLDANEQEKFLREARAAAQLRHPNIVSLHEVGREGALIYLVYDYVEGVPLAEWLGDGHVSPREAARLCASIARALQKAHEVGIIHRDIKPQNILIDRDGEPHLTDFGLARREVGEVTLTLDGQLLGTPAYMSPEQARGEAHRADGRSDVYSLGVVMFQLLTGELPFRGNARVLVQQVLNDPAPSPRTLNQHVPRDLETIVLRCLEKHPNGRFPSARYLADELDRFLKAEPIRSRPISLTARAWRWCKRRPTVASFAASLATLLILVAVVSTVAALRIATSRASERRQHYYRSVELAQRHIEDGNTRLARATLLQCPGEFRHWEWGHLMLLCHQEIASLETGSTNLLQLRFSPNSGLLLWNGSDGKVAAWDWLGQRQQFTAGNLTDRVQTAVFNANGDLLVLAYTSGKVQVWETQSWELKHERFFGMVDLLGVAARADGPVLLTTYHSGGELDTWDIVSDRQLYTLSVAAEPATSLDLSPDGERLLIQTREGLEAREALTGRMISTVRVAAAEAQELIVGPMGDCWAVIDRDGRLCLWREQGLVRDLVTIRGSEPTEVRRAFFSGDGRLLCNAGDSSTAAVWDTESGEERFRIFSRVHRAAFSPDGLHLALWGAEDRVKILSTESGREVRALAGHNRFVNRVAFSPDGGLLASSDEGGSVKVWRTTLGRERLDAGHWVWNASYSPGGGRLAVASWTDGLSLFDADSAMRRLTLRPHLDVIRSAAFSPDGDLIVTGGSQRRAKIWDVRTGKCLHDLAGHTRYLNSVDWSPSGELIGTASIDRTAKLWDPESGKEVRTLSGHEDVVITIAFSPSGNKVGTSSADGTARIWDSHSGQLLQQLVGHTDWVRCIAFTPDGRQVVTAGRDATIRLWDVATGRCRAVHQSQDDVLRFVLSPDGRRLIAAITTKLLYGYDSPTIVVWDLDASHGVLHEIMRIQAHKEPITSIGFCSDGLRLTTGSTDFTVRQWEALPWWLANESSDDTSDSLQQWRVAADKYWRHRLPAEDKGGHEPPARQAARLPLERQRIAPREGVATLNEIDLASHYTGYLDSHFQPIYSWSPSDNDLRELAQGNVILAGIAYDVRGVIQLRLHDPAGSEWDRVWQAIPERVEGIRIARNFERIHLLHGCAPSSKTSATEGTTVATLIWHFADGSQHESAIVYGVHVRDWVQRPEDQSTVLDGQVAWEGQSPWSREQGRLLRLYHCVFENPRPKIAVERLDYLSCLSPAAPFVIAMTVE